MTTLYIADQHNSIIRNEADSANLAAENADVADHAIGTDFILCVQVNHSNSGACNKASVATNLKLQYEKDGGGTWYDCTGANEVVGADVSGLTNDATGGTARCAGTPTGCGASVETVKDCEDGEVAGPAITKEYWAELKFGLSPANAAAGVKYTFRLWDDTNSQALAGTIQAEITIASAPVVSFSADIVAASSTAPIDLNAGRGFVAGIVAASSTTPIDLIVPIYFSAAIVAVSSVDGPPAADPEQYGGTNNFQAVWLPDGSILITTEYEFTAAETLEFLIEAGAARDVKLTVLRQLTAAAAAVSQTTAIDLDTGAIQFSADISAISSTAAVDLNSGRRLSAILAAKSATSNINLPVARAIIADIAGQTQTTAIDLFSTVNLSAAIVAISSTTAVDLNSGRAFAALMVATTSTAGIVLNAGRAFAADISALTTTAAIDLISSIYFSSAIVAASSTSAIDLNAGRALSGSISLRPHRQAPSISRRF
jgi:hypothetical protein